jgi:hypothetical protein
MTLFPEHRATAIGLANLGGSFGATYLGNLSRAYMNPENIDPSIQVMEGDRISKYFDSRVTEKFSEFWSVLGAVTLAAGFLCVPWMSRGSQWVRGKKLQKNSRLPETSRWQTL